MQGDQVGLCRRRKHGKRLSKHPSNSKGSEPVCQAVTVKGHMGSSPGLGRPRHRAPWHYSEQQGKLISLAALRLILEV